MAGGVQIFIYEESDLGVTIIDSREISLYDEEAVKKSLEETVRILRHENPGKCYSWKIQPIQDQPISGTQFD